MTQQSDLAAPASEARPAQRRSMVLAAATLGFGVIQLDVSVVNVAVKPIGAALGGGVSGVQWVVDAYSLVFAALILSAGALGDRSGHKRLLLAGFAVFTLASAACGLVPDIGELIAARAVQGAGAAALVTEVSRNSGLPPSRMAKRLFEEQPRPKVKSDDDVPHG